MMNKINEMVNAMMNGNVNGNGKGDNNMNNINMENLDMNKLAELVAIKIAEKTCGVETEGKQPEMKTEEEINIVTGENNWAKTSGLYGKEICGYIYNPYLVRRFVPKQYMELVSKYGWSGVNKAIREEWSVNDCVKYMIEECEKLSMLQKRDKIAFDERKKFWSYVDTRTIFIDYLGKVEEFIDKRIRESLLSYSYPTTIWVQIKGYGSIKVSSNFELNRYGDKIMTYTVDDPILDDVVRAMDKIMEVYIYDADPYAKFATIMKNIKLVRLPHHCREKYEMSYTRGGIPAGYKRKVIDVPGGYKICQEFLDGFKKTGAFYTLKDKLMFEGYEMDDYKGRRAVYELVKLLNDGTPGYVFHAKLRDMIKNDTRFLVSRKSV